MSGPARDAPEVEALQTDRYLEALLAAADRGADDVPADAAVDPTVREAARRLARELVRVHPSFRFEERLAGRLAEAARGMRLAPAAGGETAPMDFRSMPRRFEGEVPGPDVPDLRAYLIGGAITSAALSLAGAAWVAWRRARPPARSPMARAVRAARHARDTRLPRPLD